ncbi:MAG: peptidoglycan DD-metalloendopeptidase family protein [Candidatus Moranbacteria bacterium]|nr:peptidoglycan DD-metalloendopeptidase family protein [Candidatus Moranbacteria bacterium]
MTRQNKNIYASFFLTALFFGSVLFSVSANAADTGDLTSQLDAINAKIKAYKQIIDLKQRQGSTLANQIQSLEAQANKLQLEIDLNQQKLGDLEGNITLLSSRITEKEAVSNSQKQMLSELMRLYYSDYSNTSTTLIFSSAETLSFLNQENWTTQLSGKVSELLDSIKTLRESLVNERAVLETKKNEATTLNEQLNARNDYLESAKESKAYLLTKTQAEVNKYDNLVDDLQKQRDEIENEIEDLESGKIGTLDLKDMPAFKHGTLSYPLKKFTLSQGYGKTTYARKSGSYGKANFHNGLDFAAPSGTPIYAALGGKVVGVGNNGRYAYGRWVAIDHGDGIVTLYGHMSVQSVRRGQSVKEGEKIGAVGSTGNSTGPHVHFTVFSEKTFEVVPSKYVSSVKDIPIGATVNPSVYLP